jgi:hypothetical protein
MLVCWGDPTCAAEPHSLSTKCSTKLALVEVIGDGSDYTPLAVAQSAIVESVLRFKPASSLATRALDLLVLGEIHLIGLRLRYTAPLLTLRTVVAAEFPASTAKGATHFLVLSQVYRISMPLGYLSIALALWAVVAV